MQFCLMSPKKMCPTNAILTHVHLQCETTVCLSEAGERDTSSDFLITGFVSATRGGAGALLAAGSETWPSVREAASCLLLRIKRQDIRRGHDNHVCSRSKMEGDGRRGAVQTAYQPSTPTPSTATHIHGSPHASLIACRLTSNSYNTLM